MNKGKRLDDMDKNGFEDILKREEELRVERHR